MFNRIVVRTLLLVSIVLLTQSVPDVKASCFTPRRRIVQYLGWTYPPNLSGIEYTCTWPNISPYHPPTVIGEMVTECDGTQWSWGYTDASCQTVVVHEACDEICE